MAPEGAMSVDQNDRCPLCGTTRRELLVVGRDRAVARGAEYRYERCLECRLVMLRPLPAESSIAGFYPDDYAPHAPTPRPRRDKWVNRLAERHFYATDSVVRSAAVRAVFRLLSGRILREIREPIGENRMLDVGCGAGELLAGHRDLGWSVCGIEPSAKAAAVCRARGLDVHVGTILDAPFAVDERFDVIIASHVIEHVREPVVFLRRASELLAPDGRIVLTTPNVRSAGFWLYGADWFALDPPRHLYLFEPRSLARLAAASGLAVAKLATRIDPEVYARSREYTRGVRGARPWKPLTVLLAPLAWARSGDVIEAELARVSRA